MWSARRAHVNARANIIFVAVVHSVSRIWPAPGQPHLCQGHLPREPGSPRRQHPGRGRRTEGEGEGVGEGARETLGTFDMYRYTFSY